MVFDMNLKSPRDDRGLFLICTWGSLVRRVKSADGGEGVAAEGGKVKARPEATSNDPVSQLPWRGRNRSSHRLHLLLRS